MSTITLPNIRVSSDLTVGVVLKDGGVAIDWSTLSNIKAYLYADAQRAMAGRCSVAVDEEDSTRLVCSYRANKPQYIGVNRIVITCTYRGETKTFDKPALNFVRWTDDQAGQQITIDDPDVDVEIEVEDVSSSILEQAIAAALQAAADAEHAAHLIPNQVLLDCEQATAGANAAAEAANAAGITSVNVSVEDNEPGTPSAECSLANKVLSVIFHYLKGETGDAAGFGTISASFVEDGGDPSVLVTTSGPDTAKNIAFTLKNFKGDKGDKGDQGNTGSSVDYPYELVNNLTTNDATKGLTAAMGVQLEGEVSQLEAKMTDLDAYLDHSPVTVEPNCGYTNWQGTGKIEKTTGSATFLTASCQEGDVFFFEIIDKSSASNSIWNIVDAEDNLVRRGNTYTNATNGDKGFIVIPTNGVKLIVIVPGQDISGIYLCRGEKIADSVKNNGTEIKTVAEKVGIIKPEVELIDGKYIYKTGAVYVVAGGFLTKPFSALKGDKIKINCVNWYSSGAAVGCVLAKCTGQDSSGTPTGITPLVLPTSANRETYEYTLTEDASLTVSFKMYGSSGQSTFAEPCGIVIERPVSSGSGEYVPIQQGVGNSGKLLGVGVDGNVTLVSGKVTIDKSEEYVLYQKIKNGDFSDGLDDWTAAPATNISVEDGMLKINTAASVQCRQEFDSIASGHKVYLVYYAKRGSSAANPQASLGNLSAAFTYNYKDTITESLAMYSHLATLTSSVDRITFSRDGSGSIYYVDNVRIYDLTEIFGAGNEPTLEECDALFNGTEEMTVKDYVETKIATITNIKENQLSEAVQIKLNAGGGGGTASKWLGAKVGCLGDSITAIDNNLKKYYRYMEDFYTLSGVSVAAISGATISSYSNPFYNRVTDLAADCDLVLVLGGINDFNHGVSIGEICTVDGSGAKTATSDTSTFFGALHTMVQNLITRFPTKPIVLMTPLHSGGYNSGGTSYPSDLNKNSANKYLSDYVQAIKDIGAWYSIPVLDLFSVAGFNPNVADFATEYFSSSADLLHPNTNGHALIANRIEGFLNSIG